MPDSTTTPQWAIDLAIAQKAYEQAKVRRDEARAAFDAFDKVFDKIEVARRAWLEQIMAAGWRAIEEKNDAP